MRKKSVYKLDCTNINRDELIEYYSRCNVMSKKSYIDKCLYHYDAINDLLYLDKIELNNSITKVEIPRIFDAISSNCFYMNDIITEIDASHIKRISTHSIYFCPSIRSIDLRSCRYFEGKSISSCYSLKVVKFSSNIDYLGPVFIDTYLETYVLGNVYDLHRDAFSHPYYENINLQFKYVKFLPFIGSRNYTITLNDCDEIDGYYYLNPYKSNIHYNRLIRCLGDREKFKSLLVNNLRFDVNLLFE